MRNVPHMSLADISQLVQYGYTASASDMDIGPKFLRITDIVPPQIDWDNVPHCKIDERKFSKFCLEQDDIVIARTGATVGYAKLIREQVPSVFASYLVRVRIDPEKADPKYVGRIVESSIYKRFVLSRVGGAAQPNANAKILASFRLPIPGKRIQLRVVEILSAYDDLIENNRRRIALLEAVARLLYREWFVHFRFPGHEHGKIIDGLPEGWERCPIAKIADVFRGKSYKSSELVDADGQPFINLKCIERFGGFRVSGLKRFRGNHKEHHSALPGDIVIAVTDMTRDAMIVAQAARVPKTVGEKAIYSMDLVKIVPRGCVESAWLYGMLRFSQFSSVVREEATGATVLHLKPKHIQDWNAVVPSLVVRRLFSERFGIILQQIDNLELQNENCAKARDLLLPRLMSGEIAV